MNLNELETFVVVAELGTFSAAAEQLDVPISTVSRRVARLEESLGMALLNRGTRSITLSDDGRALAERVGPMLREIAEIERGLGDATRSPRGRLRITAPIDVGSTQFVAGLVAEFAARYPDVSVELSVTNRMVDMLEEGFDVAFRSHVGALRGGDDLVMRRLGALTMHLYANPSYLTKRGLQPDNIECDDVEFVSHANDVRRWPSTSVVVDDYNPVASILAAGHGVGGLPDFVAAPHVQAGTLVQLEVPFDVPPASMSLVWLRSRHLAPRLRAFIELAAERAAAEPWLQR